MRMTGRVPIILGVLVVVLVGLTALLWFNANRRTPLSSNRNEAITNEQNEALQRARSFQGLIALVPESGVQDRVVLVGDELVGANGSRLGTVLENELRVPSSTTYRARMTTRDAVAVLSEQLAQPPKYLVLDLGRSDADSGIGLDETYSSLAAVIAKAHELGSSVVLIGGVSSSGDVLFSDIIKGAVMDNGSFIDATPLQSDPALRTSTVLLNAAGTDRLAAQIVRALRP